MFPGRRSQALWRADFCPVRVPGVQPGCCEAQFFTLPLAVWREGEFPGVVVGCCLLVKQSLLPMFQSWGWGYLVVGRQRSEGQTVFKTALLYSGLPGSPCQCSCLSVFSTLMLFSQGSKAFPPCQSLSRGPAPQSLPQKPAEVSACTY